MSPPLAGKEGARESDTNRPLTIKAANAYIEAHHRHHKRVQGHRFSLGASITGSLGDQVTVGVCVVGRPVARAVNQQFVAEVTRLCTQGHPHVCSKLYAAAARACKAMGFWRIQTYTLASEPGTSPSCRWLVQGWRREGPRLVLRVPTAPGRQTPPH